MTRLPRAARPGGIGCGTLRWSTRETCQPTRTTGRYQNDILVRMDVLIRNLPADVHAELARRAAANDMSLRAYLREVLTDHVAVPSMTEWLQHVRDLGPAHAGGAAWPYRAAIASADALAAPAHLDADVLSAFDRLRRAGHLPRATERVQSLAEFGATRWPLRPLLSPAWALADRIATRDALYVALAMSLDAILITTDGRLRRGVTGIVAVAEPDE